MYILLEKHVPRQPALPVSIRGMNTCFVTLFLNLFNVLVCIGYRMGLVSVARVGVR